MLVVSSGTQRTSQHCDPQGAAQRFSPLASSMKASPWSCAALAVLALPSAPAAAQCFPNTSLRGQADTIPQRSQFFHAALVGLQRGTELSFPPALLELSDFPLRTHPAKMPRGPGVLPRLPAPALLPFHLLDTGRSLLAAHGTGQWLIQSHVVQLFPEATGKHSGRQRSGGQRCCRTVLCPLPGAAVAHLCQGKQPGGKA